MRKIHTQLKTLMLIVAFLWPMMSFAQGGLEDFTNSNATGSYADNSFVGNNSITWSYVQSRDANGDANGSGINLPALMLRELASNSAVSSSTISGGIGDFSVKLYKGFTGGGNRQVELFVNGVSKGTSVAFDDYDEHVFNVSGINIEGDVTISIVNITSKQVIVDDITWTGYSSGGTNDTDSYADATGATQPAGTAIASTNWDASSPTATPVFQFNIADAGTADGLPTEVTEVTIHAGSNNTAVWNEDLGGGYLYKESTGTPLTIVTEPDVTGSSATFYIEDGELDVADGGSELITLYVWPGETTTDNAVMQFMIDADAHGFTADVAGSTFATDFGTDVVSNQFTSDVAATQLSFITEPTDVEVDATMTPAVEVATTDENGNVDVDYAATDVSLAYGGAGTMTGTTPVTTTSGIAAFADLSFDTEAAGVTLEATDAGATLTSAVSAPFNVNAPPVIGWANLQWPENGTANIDAPFNVYAQIYVEGVTNADNAAPGDGIDAWIGISSTDTDPSTWTEWIPATYNQDEGNNDEFMANINQGLPAGTYYYASRFQLNGGDYYYGGFDGGEWNNTTNVSGVLTVNEATISTLPYTNDFESGDLYTDGWRTKLVTGSLDWELGNFSGSDYYAEMSNYDGGNSASETWLMSPTIDLSSYTNVAFSFDNSCNYSGADIEVYISTDYDGYSAPSTATWNQLSATLSAGSWAEVNSGIIDISAYSGGNAYIAFKYTGSDSDGKTWQLDDIVIEELVVPIISDINVTPAAPLSTDDIVITANVTDADADLSTVTLNWGTASNTLGNSIAMTNTVGDTYEATITAQADGTTVYYEIVAVDDATNETNSGEMSVDVIDPATATLPYSNSFETDLGDMYIFDAEGAQGWHQSSGYAKMTGYSGTQLANIDWLITPSIDFSGVSNIQMTFDEIINYAGTIADQQEVYVSIDYTGTGDPSSATWTKLTITNRPAGNTWDWSSVDVVDLSAYAGEPSVHIAFKYTSTTSEAATWEVDNLVIEETPSSFAPVIANIVTIPDAPTSSDAISVSADVTDADGDLNTVTLNWGTTSGSLTNTINMSVSSGDTYVTDTDIPAQADGTTVYYEIVAADAIPNETNSGEMSVDVIDPASTTIPFAADFASGLGDIYTYSVLGDTKNWYHNSTDEAAKMNGYNSGDTEEDWLILPAVDLSAKANEVISFDSYMDYSFPEDATNYFKLMYSEDYSGTGDPSGATWTELTFTKPTTDGAWVSSGDVDLSAINGANVYIAFKYYYDAGSYATWQVDNISIREYSPATQLAITSVSPASPYTGQSFDVTVEAQDGTGTTQNVESATDVQLNLAVGTSSITGTLTGTIALGTSSYTFSGLTYDAIETIEVNVSATAGMTLTTSANESIVVTDVPATPNVFISEYIEGSSNNKAIEIYNGTGADVDLSAFSLQKSSNGGGTWGSEEVLSGTLTSGDVYVVANSSADAAILAESDITSGVTYYNGNDAVGLFYNSNLIDVIGVPSEDAIWDVAGVTEATAEHTLVRKYPEVTTGNTDWAASAGTNATDSEWIVFDQDEFSYIGSHTETDVLPTQLAITDVTPASPFVNGAFDVTVEALDAEGMSGNVDQDTEVEITLASGTSTFASTYTSMMSNGTSTVTITGLTYDVAEDIELQAVANSGMSLTASSTYTVTIQPEAPAVTLPYSRDFETGDLYTDGWSTQLVTGTLDWYLDSYSGDHFAKMSNYDGGNTASETWLISPEIDLSAATNPIFGFYNSCNYNGADIEVYISTDYDGESAPSTATWNPLTANLSSGGFDDVYSGDIDISAYVGGSAYVAFKYTGTDSDGKTWQIDDISIRELLTASALNIKSVSPVSPVVNTAFDVTVESLDVNGVATDVDTDTEVEINLVTGSSAFTTTYTGTISVGTSETVISGLTYDVVEDIEVQAIANTGMTLTASSTYTITIADEPVAGVFISEYIEGSSNNKAIEIYNGTGADIDLSNYSVMKSSNGDGVWASEEVLSGTLTAGDVFVIANASADAAILAEADITSSVTWYNGNDAIGLFENGVLIDVVGVPSEDANWDVAGVTGATGEHTLVRKYPEVTEGNTDWAASAGTNTDDSEWIVFDQDDFTYIGWHGSTLSEPTELAITSVTPATPMVDQQFTVEITAQDANGVAGNVDEDTEVQLSLDNGTGNLAGTLTGTIASGSSSISIAGLTYDVVEDIEISAAVNTGMALTASSTYTITIAPLPTGGVFFSEYLEGSSNNKAIEIYNGTGAELDLTSYVIKKASNGGDWSETVEDLTGTVAIGDVYVIANPSADQAILDEADITSSITYFNGNDAMGLFENDVLIDVIGVPTEDVEWDVAGVAGATAEHTLVRKFPEVTEGNTDWTASAGTNADDSEWIVFGQDEFTYIGWHGETDVTPTQLAITAVTPPAPIVGQTFSIEVEAQDANGIYGNVDEDTEVQLNLVTGSGTISGTLTATIVNGENSVVFSGLTYDVAESIDVNVSVNSGMTLTTTPDESITIQSLPVVDYPYTRDFEDGNLYTDGWTTQVVIGTLDWEIANFSGDDYYAEMSNYTGSNNESETWLITPAVDLSTAVNPVFSFYNTCSYTGADIEVYASTDYDGISAPSTATWDQLNPTLSSGSFEEVFSGDMDISAYNGENVYFAFKYTGTDSDGKTWQIDDISVAEEVIIVPTKLAITAVDPAEPVVGNMFSVTVEAQDADGNAGEVTEDTEVEISLVNGTGTLSGTVTGTIAAESSSVTISDLSYDVVENIEIEAGVNSGMSLTTSDIFSIQLLGIFDNAVKELAVYPNPVQSDLTIEGLNGTSQITIITMEGKVVMDKQTSNNTLNVGSLNDGLYIIRVIGENHVYTTRFIKE